MTVQQAVTEITSKPRWYDGVMSQSHGSQTLKAINNGSAGIKKIKNFIEKFGYKVEINLEVSK